VPELTTDRLRDPELVETLAEEVHNAWWEEKKRQGKDDTHPDAVLYYALTEEVKEYDRVTVRVVLHALINEMEKEK